MNDTALSTLLLEELGYTGVPDLREPTSWRTGRGISHVENVFEVQNVPMVYFARLSEADPDALWQLHRNVWNESKVPLLYVVLPQEIRIYNGYMTPAANATDFIQDEKPRLLRQLTALTDIETARQTIRRELVGAYDRFHLETGSFWFTSDGQRVTPSYRADRTLLRSLAQLRRDLIKDGVDNEIAYRLIGRSLLICYLRDRRLLMSGEEPDALGVAIDSYGEILNSHQSTYRFFEQLTERFGGDLFPVQPQEKKLVSERHLNLLKAFLEGEDLASGQRRFWPYNFEYIPIELISAIYDTFLQVGPRRKLGAFYTPLSLVDFVLEETLPLESLDNKTRVLDPACGSGIFLMRAFQRFVRTWQASHEQPLNAEVLSGIIHEQLFGVDRAEEAIHIAAFSLYLAMLDFLGAKEVSAVAFRFPHLSGHNLIHTDFFAQHLEDQLGRGSFHRIIGNPPWGKGSLQGPAREWVNRNGKSVGGEQIVHAFLWRALDFCSEDGEVALIAPTKGTIIVSSATHEEFRRSFFSKIDVRAVVNFSALRYELFPDSLNPVVALFYTGRKPSEDRRIVYGVPKPSPLSQHLRAIVLEGSEVKFLDRPDVQANPELWKVALWGSQRDASLVLRLKSQFTLKEVSEQLGWDIGEGMQIGGGDENYASWAREIPHLSTRGFEPFVLNKHALGRLDNTIFHRHRERKRYAAPLVLIHKSRCEAALVDYDLTYTDSITGVVGDPDTLPYMKMLVAYINSPLARYYQFLTSTRWGVERDNPIQEDYLRMPLIRPNSDDPRLQEIVGTFDQLRVLQTESNDLGLDVTVTERERLHRRLNEIIYDLFELTSTDVQQVQDFIDNEIPFFDWSKRKGRKAHEFPAVRAPNAAQLREYAEIFIGSVQSILTLQGLGLSGIVYTNSGPLTVAGFRLVRSAVEHNIQVLEGHELYNVLQRLDQLLLERRTEQLYFRRHVKLYDQQTIYLIKPSERRLWTRSQARADGDGLLLEWLARDQRRTSVKA